LTAETPVEDEVISAFHELVIVCPAGHTHARVQFDRELVDSLVIVTLAVNPPCQVFGVIVTEQTEVAGVVVVVGAADVVVVGATVVVVGADVVVVAAAVVVEEVVTPQGCPFRVNEVTGESELVHVPSRPNVSEELAGIGCPTKIGASPETVIVLLAAVTAEPDCVITAFHESLTVSPDGHAHPTDQLLSSDDVLLLTVTLAVKPPALAPVVH